MNEQNKSDKHLKAIPPQWATKFLQWYCKEELVEDLQGDLTEYFERNAKSKGIRQAKLIYIIDVFKFMRLYTIRKPQFINTLINWIMLSSYVKTSGRNIMHNKLFSFINVVGLAVSMSVGLFLIGVLTETLSYDRFHKNYDKIYRVISRYQYLNNKDENFNATSSLKAASSIQQNFTGVESVAIFRRGFDGDFAYNESVVSLSGYFANESVLDVFSFPLTQGDAATALKEPFSIVVTERTALKLFGNGKALGEIVRLNNDRDYTVTGVMQDLPRFSHIQFDILASLSTRQITEVDNQHELTWDNIWNTWVYVLIPENNNTANVQAALDLLSLKEDPTVENTHIELALQPLSDIMIGDNLSNQIGYTMGSTLILVFIGLTVVVILSACFNYTNLSIARSFKRSSEVGIRKVMGAVKYHVLGQFITESVIIALISLVLSLIIFQLLKPYFIGLSPDLQQVLSLELSLPLVISFVLFAIFIGIVSGIFPALYFSRVNAIHTLKSSSVKVAGNFTGRKVLILVQYCISLSLITATVIMYNQYHHFLNFDLGYNTGNVLNIRLQGSKPELMIKELSSMPEVKSMSQAAMVTSIGSLWGISMTNPNNPQDSGSVRMNRIDENYLTLFEHKLLAGRNFMFKPKDAIENEVIVNEQVLKRFDIAERIPTKAIGQVVRIDGKEMTIIGVIKDFQYGRANNVSGDPVVLLYLHEEPQYINVKFSTQDYASFYQKLIDSWKRVDPVHSLEARLYKDELREGLRGLDASMKLAGYIAILAIVIASLGMLGMVVFTTETRLKEVGIRKVVGASESGLIYLLGKNFIFLLVLAASISLPLTYLFFMKVMLPMVANHAPITPGDMLYGPIFVMFIAIAMIVIQTAKISRTSPAEVLKNE